MNTQPTRESQRILVALALCMALQMTGFIMILPLFARRFESFGAGVEALSASALAYALACTLSAPFMGILADRFGRRPIILLSLLAYALTFSGFLLTTSAWLFILLRGLAGLFTAGLVPAILGTVGDLAPENRRARWIGIVQGGASVGWIIGPFFGGLLYDRFDYVVPFVVSIAMEIGALLLAVFLVRESFSFSAHPASPHLTSGFDFRALPALPGLTLLMLISFSVMFTWAFIEPEFMFYAYEDLGWTSSRLGLIMGAYGFACMFGEFALAQLSDRIGRKPVLVLGLALFSTQFIGLALFRDANLIMGSFILAGLGNSLFDPALSAHLMDITPTKQTARLMGLKATAGSLGSMLGPALIMLFTSRVSPQVIFLVSSGPVIMLALASALALRVPQPNDGSSHISNAVVSR